MSKKPVTEPVESEQTEASQEGETLTMVKQLAEAKKRWSPSRTQVGVGAAIGSAAVVAALLYWRGNRK
ncbi:hypothetical protein [Sphingomonas sp. G-3-2-10]|uniref:hypothetical protein n=1 Tax=Sphingomonas sp. G-3-2-10 TaxID=2728838 RepID=UPI00146E346B|nr:hypothetical protein [Sphingomonas sp. G-3-2-10]NML05404.1 hypothetical protein [Sphingomonas sp. G-3-2-10]